MRMNKYIIFSGLCQRQDRLNLAGTTTRGFSLLEVLVTLIVVSIGLLSIAQLQARALQYSYASLQRTVATVQVNDLIERMWTGLCEESTVDGTENGTPIFPDHILTQWRVASGGHDLLPNWSADWDDSEAPLYRITINWSEDRIEGGLQSLPFSFQLLDPNIGCSG